MYTYGMKRITLVLKIDLYEKLKALAKLNHRSLQGQLVTIVEEAVKAAGL